MVIYFFLIYPQSNKAENYFYQKIESVRAGKRKVENASCYQEIPARVENSILLDFIEDCRYDVCGFPIHLMGQRAGREYG
jgi:hypothetical protein